MTTSTTRRRKNRAATTKPKAKAAAPAVPKQPAAPKADAPASGELFGALLGRVQEIAGAEIAPAKSNAYTRVRLDLGSEGTTTLAYIWISNKRGVLVDLYLPSSMRRPAGFDLARGRARKEGFVASAASPKELDRIVKGMEKAADALKAEADPLAASTS